MQTIIIIITNLAISYVLLKAKNVNQNAQIQGRNQILSKIRLQLTTGIS